MSSSNTYSHTHHLHQQQAANDELIINPSNLGATSAVLQSYDNNNNNLNTSNYDTKPKKKFRLQISERLHWTAILAFVSYIILLISFASPYWMTSYKFTYSAFKKLGLWDFCFDEYRHPSYQYDTRFNGCHWIYNPVYTNIRDWLQPAWFIFVQASATIALCIDTIGLITVSLIFMHYFVQYHVLVLCTAFVCHVFTTMFLLFAVLTFALKSFDKSWIPYPHFNHLDWAYYFALISMLANGLVSYSYYKEISEIKQRLVRLKRIVNSQAVNSRQGENDSIDALYESRLWNFTQV